MQDIPQIHPHVSSFETFTSQKMKIYIKDLFSKCETEVDPSFVIIIKLLSNAIAESFCERIESNV